MKNENVPNYVTESAYTEDINGHSNVGEPQNRQRAAILDVATGEVKWVDAGLGDREIQLQAPVWNEAGTKAFLVARALDNKDRWILALDPATGKTRLCSPNTTKPGSMVAEEEAHSAAAETPGG